MTDDTPMTERAPLPEDTRRPRPLRDVTATATATGSALAVALLPVVVGALLARTAGGDPMVSVNALIAGGGQRARLSRAQLRVSGGRAVATARGVLVPSGRRFAHQGASSASGPGPRRLARHLAALPKRPHGSFTELSASLEQGRPPS
ncbi:hypothetical protein [Streptomyces roseicoloratus]|uniref:Uncharacterized protein n=1 Tax=Streptomyces roseicoloratus TaxID=2508722 RepID=A0ABY9S253_9ACTN|nr:hypothetical protein [Streptomyces roseicoloratus]WMX48505.1 hypothetical protein RGF97_32030 [Streptomyces roseicoloratus]